MVDYREILRLISLKYSQRMIESSAGSSRHTINAVLTAAKNACSTFARMDDFSRSLRSIWSLERTVLFLLWEGLRLIL